MYSLRGIDSNLFKVISCSPSPVTLPTKTFLFPFSPSSPSGCSDGSTPPPPPPVVSSTVLGSSDSLEFSEGFAFWVFETVNL